MEMKTIAQQLNIKKFPFIIKDDDGRKIYFEVSDNGWYKCEYDSNGNEIYFENSSEYWARSEYDSNGNVIYFEDSQGKITDKRPKLCEPNVVEIDGIKYKLTKI